MAPTTPTDRLLTKQIGWTPKKVSNTDEFRPPRRFYLMRSAFVTTRKPGKQHDSINRQEDRCDRRAAPGRAAQCGRSDQGPGERCPGGALKGAALKKHPLGCAAPGVYNFCRAC